ncbi:hypothetical protein SMD44_01754 [Streptomyces alboflavus]|uniref:Uncharacterized protein n=1 Tax=Streptomyces alboflavus TaxID=67267 RepID=A0A1Z1W7H1_9ACTN|nr:hypothetical protein SMD44_01754 [Streptomyces alboflavus]
MRASALTARAPVVCSHVRCRHGLLTGDAMRDEQYAVGPPDPDHVIRTA